MHLRGERFVLWFCVPDTHSRAVGSKDESLGLAKRPRLRPFDKNYKNKTESSISAGGTEQTKLYVFNFPPN